MDRCADCRHWGSMIADEKSGDYVAPCLKNPPTFVFGVERGCWPITEFYDRCGSFQVIEVDPPAAPTDEDHAEDCACVDCIPF